jgi:hypothetical protein
MIFYFAWVDPEETTFSPEHLVQDEQIVNFDLTHQEGGFAKLSIDVRNPKVGPLSASRQFWAWFSYRETELSDPVPLMFGRIVGIPSNILGEVITYELIARPINYPTLKAALAETLRVLPFYDEIFIADEMREDPDVVLEGYSALWHIDRTTHEVTVSDVLVGEDGVETFDPADIPYHSLSISMARVPLSSVTVKGSVPWVQTGTGTFSFGPVRWQSADAASTAQGWPKVGDTMAGGYKVVASSASGARPSGTMSYDYTYTNREEEHDDNDILSMKESFSRPITGLGFQKLVSFKEDSTSAHQDSGTPGSLNQSYQHIGVQSSTFEGSLTLAVDTDRDRKDSATIIVTSELQPVLRDPDDTNDTEIIELNAEDASKICAENTGDVAAIENAGRSEYISTDRGVQSIAYMIARARSRLLLSARAVDVTFNCRFGVAAGLSCRMNGLIADERIPGGEALGKIVSYSMRGDGNSGEFIGSVTLSCAVGLGGAIELADGEGDYVDADYVDDYQTFTGQVVALPSGDIGYGPPVLVDGGGGVAFPLSRDQVVIRAEIMNADADPVAIVNDSVTTKVDVTVGPQERGTAHSEFYDENARKIIQAIASRQTWYELELLDLKAAGIEAHWAILATPLVIPMQIDLMESTA